MVCVFVPGLCTLDRYWTLTCSQWLFQKWAGGWISCRLIQSFWTELNGCVDVQLFLVLYPTTICQSSLILVVFKKKNPLHRKTWQILIRTVHSHVVRLVIDVNKRISVCFSPTRVSNLQFSRRIIRTALIKANHIFWFFFVFLLLISPQSLSTHTPATS